MLFFAPEAIAPELRRPTSRARSRSPTRAGGCCPERAPELHELVTAVHRDPDALSDALRSHPATFVAGDWKLGNLGRRPDGRTVLLDWAYPGEAPPCWDLTWYLALNRARLPELQGGDDRPATARGWRPRSRHRRLVGPAARPEPGRHGGGVRLGEGGR